MKYNLNHIVIEVIATELSLYNKDTIKIIAAYQQSNSRIQEIDITSIFNNEQPTLLIGDLNSKHTQWGCIVNNLNVIKFKNYRRHLRRHNEIHKIIHKTA